MVEHVGKGLFLCLFGLQLCIGRAVFGRSDLVELYSDLIF